VVTRSMRPPTPKLSLNCRRDIDAGVALAWLRQFAAQDFEHWATVGFDEAMRAEALLMGRGSDEYFGARWTSRPGEWADRLRSLPKYVVSSTLKDPMWTNATVLNGDVVEEVSKLKQRIAGEIVVYASASLVQTLIEKDLVDELPLTVYPVVPEAVCACSARQPTRNPCGSFGLRLVARTSPISSTNSCELPKPRWPLPGPRQR
jgi:dihydrofolate reductase